MTDNTGQENKKDVDPNPRTEYRIRREALQFAIDSGSSDFHLVKRAKEIEAYLKGNNNA